MTKKRKTTSSRSMSFPRKKKYIYADQLNNVIVELPYADTINLNSAVVGYTEHTFSLNNLFDPDTTGVGTGHQPLGFDEYSELFRRYEVYECKYEVWIQSNSTNQQVAGATVVRASSSFPSRTEAMEHPTSQVKLLPARNSAHPDYVTGLVNIQKFDGNPVDDGSYGAGVGSSPSKQTFLKVWVADLASGTSIDANFIVRLTYKAKFFERENLTQS